jgi:outer membrane receptor for ferrienterochelin and colicin
VFRSSYAIAPIEKRIGFDAIYKTDDIETSLSWTWFGRRHLNRYGYLGYDILGDERSLKSKDAPSFSALNFKFQYNLTAEQSVYAGVANLTDKLQLDSGQSPLFYDAEGSYDVGYIYGPLHGRELYVGYKISL